MLSNINLSTDGPMVSSYKKSSSKVNIDNVGMYLKRDCDISKVTVGSLVLISMVTANIGDCLDNSYSDTLWIVTRVNGDELDVVSLVSKCSVNVDIKTGISCDKFNIVHIDYVSMEKYYFFKSKNHVAFLTIGYGHNVSIVAELTPDENVHIPMRYDLLKKLEVFREVFLHSQECYKRVSLTDLPPPRTLAGIINLGE